MQKTNWERFESVGSKFGVVVDEVVTAMDDSGRDKDGQHNLVEILLFVLMICFYVSFQTKDKINTGKDVGRKFGDSLKSHSLSYYFFFFIKNSSSSSC